MNVERLPLPSPDFLKGKKKKKFYELFHEFEAILNSNLRTLTDGNEYILHVFQDLYDYLSILFGPEIHCLRKDYIIPNSEFDFDPVEISFSFYHFIRKNKKEFDPEKDSNLELLVKIFVLHDLMIQVQASGKILYASLKGINHESAIFLRNVEFSEDDKKLLVEKMFSLLKDEYIVSLYSVFENRILHTEIESEKIRWRHDEPSLVHLFAKLSNDVKYEYNEKLNSVIKIRDFPKTIAANFNKVFGLDYNDRQVGIVKSNGKDYKKGQVGVVKSKTTARTFPELDKIINEIYLFRDEISKKYQRS